jgi:hypothetical protein
LKFVTYTKKHVFEGANFPKALARLSPKSKQLKLSLLGITMRYFIISISLLALSACSTALAVADTVGSVVVYGAKTVVNTIDALTPDIVNKK